MSTEFDSPRALPDDVVQAWEAAGLWTVESLSDIIDGDVDANRIACVVDDQRLTFGDLHRWSTAVARSLADAGVQRSDRIVMQLPNSAELVVSVLAAWRLVAVAVPVVPLFRQRELRSVIRQSRPAAVISTAAFRSRTPLDEIDAAVQACGIAPRFRLSVRGRSTGWSMFPVADIADVAGDDGAPGFLDASACALVLFTSGTTAEPKGVRHDSRSLLAEARSYVRAARLTANDIVFNPAPIAHIAPVVATVLLPCSPERASCCCHRGVRIGRLHSSLASG